MNKSLITLMLIWMFILTSCINGSSLEKEVKKSNEKLNELQEKILNRDFTHDERVGMTFEYINLLVSFLEKENMKMSNAELEERLNCSVKVFSKKESNLRVRIIRYDGLPNLFGTLERIWTIIQWSDDDGIHVQLLNDQNAELVKNIIIIKKDDDNNLLLLGGYLTSYYPPPVFVSSFLIHDGQCKPTVLLSDEDTLNETFLTQNNQLIYEKYVKMNIEINDDSNGFVVSNFETNEKYFEILIENGSIVIK